jgi:multidrug efflux pump
MKLTDLFIKRPILAVVVNVVLLIVGIRAALSLPVQQYPAMASTSIKISTRYFGASAEDVRGFVTTPIERVVASIDGVDYVESKSTPGLSEITIRLKLNENPTAALAEVSTKLAQVRSQLPFESESPGVEVTSADRPFASFYLSCQSASLDRMRLTEFISRQVEPMLTSVSGVQRAEVLGGTLPAMRIWLDPQRLAGLNLSPSDVERALQRNNFIAAIGQTRSESIQISLVTNTDLKRAEQFQEIIVREEAGAVVRLKDVARVELGAEEAYTKTSFGGEDAIFLGIWSLPGVNEIELAGRLRTRIAEIQEQLPSGTTLDLAYDATLYMDKAIKEIAKTLVETILIVGIVVFLFMGSVRTVLVPLVAIPLSLLGAAVFMLLAGFSLNLLTILAIVLAVGLVVDDAIVVVENIERRVREGNTRFQAAILGARELFAPIIAMTITLAAVYAPIGFQGGLTGILFKEFAFTLAAAVVVSGIVAVTLSPIMSSVLVHDAGKQGRWTRWVNKRFDSIRHVYGWLLEGMLRMPKTLALLSVMAVVVIPPLYLFSTRELAPVEDQSGIFMAVTGAPESTLAYNERATLQMVDVLKGVPETRHIWQITFPNGGFGGIQTVPWGSRERTTHEILPELQGKLGMVPSLTIFPMLPASLPGAGQFDVELVITSDLPPAQMAELARKVIDDAMASGMLMYADTDLKIDMPQARIVLDKDKIADLGFDPQLAGRELSVLLSGGYVNRFNLDGRSYTVVPQLPDDQRAFAEQLLSVQVAHPSGTMVPLGAFASIETTVGPRELNRFGQRNAVRINAGVPPGLTKAQGLEAVESAARKHLPTGASIDYLGESRQIRKESSSLVATMGLALVMIYLVLAAQFASFRDPLIILLGSVPLAIASALAITFADLTSINIYSQVGLITLVGLVSKNGILIVEFARTLQEHGMSKLEAIREASQTRLRPILMTSAATVFGHLPLVFVSGAGAASRNSIGIVLVVGMLLGTLFTLVVVPALYMLIASKERAHSDDLDAKVESAVKTAKDRGALGELEEARGGVAVA